jgi:hypothetical protein
MVTGNKEAAFLTALITVFAKVLRKQHLRLPTIMLSPNLRSHNLVMNILYSVKRSGTDLVFVVFSLPVSTFDEIFIILWKVYARSTKMNS